MVFDLASWFGIPDIASRLNGVENALRQRLGSEFASIEAASHRVALGGGKRLRPALVIACASLGRADERIVESASAAVELLQVGSLVHDDLFENASTRRGVPTISAAEGPSHAILIGDFILARAGESAASAGDAVARCIAETVERLCVGQIDEMLAAFDVDRSMDSCLRSIDAKTGALYACAARLGGICGGLEGSALEAVSEYGRLFGIAFQLVDDLLDLIGDPAKLGKPTGMDMPSGVFNAPVVLAMDESLRETLLSRDWERASATVRRSAAMQRAIGMAEAFAWSATRALSQFNEGDVASALRAFPKRYVAWALD